jgi:hypothetical protein
MTRSARLKGFSFSRRTLPAASAFIEHIAWRLKFKPADLELYTERQGGDAMEAQFRIDEFDDRDGSRKKTHCSMS